MIIHAHRPTERSLHDCTYYMRRGKDETLGELLLIEKTQYLIYGNTKYNQHPFKEVQFQVSNIVQERCEFNEAMSIVRVTVE